MNAVTNAKAFRVSYDETYQFHVDVIACAEWQALEIARTLRENASNAIIAESEEPLDVGNWKAVPLEIGGQP